MESAVEGTNGFKRYYALIKYLLQKSLRLVTRNVEEDDDENQQQNIQRVDGR